MKLGRDSKGKAAGGKVRFELILSAWLGETALIYKVAISSAEELACFMDFERDAIRKHIEAELAEISNELVLRHVKNRLVHPEPISLSWDYGAIDQQFSCWIVLVEASEKCGIAFCNQGFGPECPWGLVAPEPSSSMGMDSAWFPTFMQAYLESAASEIPIWCIVKEEASGLRHQITDGGEWDQTWAQTMALRKANTDAHYHVETIVLGNS